MIINPYTYATAGGPAAPDFSGLNITRTFGLYKTSLTTLDYPIGIVRSAGDTTVYRVHWDGNEITGNSAIFNGATDTGDTLSDLAVTYADWDVVELYCHQTGEVLDEGALATRRNNCRIIESNTIQTLNGKTSMCFKAQEGLEYGSGFTALDNGNDFTLYAVCNNNVSNGVGAIYSNNTDGAISNDSRVSVFVDRRTAKLCGYLKNTSATVYLADLTAQNNTATQRRLAITVGGGNIKSYQNDVLQNTTAISGSWVNDNFIVGAQRQGASGVDGHFQFGVICNNDLSSVDLSNLDGKVDDILSF